MQTFVLSCLDIVLSFNFSASIKGLIERVSFMNVTLSELEEDINKNGSIELFKNGSQEFYKESASVKTYTRNVHLG